MRHEGDIEKARFDKLRNDFNSMALKLEEIKLLAEERKKTVDSLSAELGRCKRKVKTLKQKFNRKTRGDIT